jgi:hypothetical protein
VGRLVGDRHHHGAIARASRILEPIRLTSEPRAAKGSVRQAGALVKIKLHFKQKFGLREFDQAEQRVAIEMPLLFRQVPNSGPDQRFNHIICRISLRRLSGCVHRLSHLSVIHDPCSLSGRTEETVPAGSWLIRRGNLEIQKKNTAAPGNKVLKNLPLKFLNLEMANDLTEEAFSKTRGLSGIVQA